MELDGASEDDKRTKMGPQSLVSSCSVLMVSPRENTEVLVLKM